MRGLSCQLALNIINLNFEDVYITHPLMSDIIFLYQLTQACPHNALHFFSKAQPVSLPKIFSDRFIASIPTT